MVCKLLCSEADRWAGGGVMVWGAITFNHRTALIDNDGSINEQRYISKARRPAVVPFFALHRDVTYFQQDHSARITTAFLRQQSINMLPCPAFSIYYLGRAGRQCHPHRHVGNWKQHCRPRGRTYRKSNYNV